MKKIVLIDEGHGINTLGKRSPRDEQGVQLWEYLYNRELGGYVVSACRALGLEAVRIVPELLDVPLSERVRRVNAKIKEGKGAKFVLYSIHANAAGNGSEWQSARGWECWTTEGQNNSDTLATLLFDEVAKNAAGFDIKMRKDMTDGDADKERNFTLLAGANCPAVLSENLFFDNRADCALMRKKEVLQMLGNAHAQAAAQYFKRFKK